MDNMGGNLIFLISQPRSGSTLLQHILGSHSEIHTLPEPWIMLHLVYALRPTGLRAEYDSKYAYLALKEFVARIGTGNGEALYIAAVRNMALAIYGQALKSSRKRYFLDKTPRYYFIARELYQIFPNATFIFLIRNPLAVLSSILEVNFKGDWRQMFAQEDRKHDLFTAPRLILDAIEAIGEQAVVVKYEQLVTRPKEVVKYLCQRIGVKFEIEMLNYGGKVRFDGTTFVDPKSVYKHDRPVTQYVDDWVLRLNSPQKVRIAKEYLSELGEDTVRRLGYSYEELWDKLESIKIKRTQLTVPLKLLITPPSELRWWDCLRLAVIGSISSRGLRRIDESETMVTRDQLVDILFAENVLARRYFYPGCHRMEPYRSYSPHAGLLLPETEELVKRVLVLPTGTAISSRQIAGICNILRLVIEHGGEVRERLQRPGAGE